MNIKQLGRVSFHTIAFVMYLAAIVKFSQVGPMPHRKPHEEYAGRWKYLTYWNLWIQLLYFGFSLYIDFKKASSLNYMKLTHFRDKMYASIALPYGLFVFAVFWILYSINREYIYPQVLDSIFPVWLNHVSHTLIAPMLVIETWLLRHNHPKRKAGLSLTVLFGAVYITWVLYLALVMDVWVYPILPKS
uniref:Clone 805 transcribed RNA sequence n=1 Tax=Plectreurys tristis TaxID=33319 RepID=A0A0C4W5V9_PLETR|nr:androgen-induced 1-like protein [Plectreurys tristis]